MVLGTYATSLLNSESGETKSPLSFPQISGQAKQAVRQFSYTRLIWWMDVPCGVHPA